MDNLQEDAGIDVIRQTMNMANKLIPLMTNEEILKTNSVFMDMFERLKKEGRIREANENV